MIVVSWLESGYRCVPHRERCSAAGRLTTPGWLGAWSELVGSRRSIFQPDTGCVLFTSDTTVVTRVWSSLSLLDISSARVPNTPIERRTRNSS